VQDTLKPNGFHENVKENNVNNVSSKIITDITPKVTTDITSKVTTDNTSNIDSIEITVAIEDRQIDKEKKLKVLQKKLKQIASLEEKITKGEILDTEQKTKINRKRELEDELAALKI